MSTRAPAAPRTANTRLRGTHSTCPVSTAASAGFVDSMTPEVMGQSGHPLTRVTPRHTSGYSVGSAGGAGRVSEVAAALLLALDRLEQRLEVALAEAEGAVTLDQLEEHRRAVLDGAGEDLQQVAVLVAVDEDAALLQLLDPHADVADALPQLGVLVVGVRGREELHALGGHRVDRGQDVVGGQRQVLGAGATVELEVLVDLAL